MNREIKHSSASTEWYTPEKWVEACRATLGQIDLDPASCVEAQKVVRASWYYTKAEDGLTSPWFGHGGFGTVFLNPPGGWTRDAYGVRRSSTVLWWERLLAEYYGSEYRGSCGEVCGVSSAIFVGFNIEVLQTCVGIERFPIAVPSGRIAFERIIDGERVPGVSPAHASCFVLVTEHDDHDTHSAFVREFEKLGCRIWQPRGVK